MLYRYTGEIKEWKKRTCRIISGKSDKCVVIEFLDNEAVESVRKKDLQIIAINQTKESKTEIARFRIGR